jgi:hypothetical protein
MQNGSLSRVVVAAPHNLSPPRKREILLNVVQTRFFCGIIKMRHGIPAFHQTNFNE